MGQPAERKIGSWNSKKATVGSAASIRKLCPWTDAIVTGRTWDDDFTDAVVEVLASEKNNRERRCAKKAEREQAEGKEKPKRREKPRREEG